MAAPDMLQIAAKLDKDETVEDMLLRHRKEGAANCFNAWKKATVCQRYANDADQWGGDGRPSSSSGGTQVATAGGKAGKRLSVNEIGPVLETLSGRQMMQRLERQYQPRNPDQAAFAEVMTSVDKAMMDACDAEQVESAAFKDGPGTQGVSLIRFEYDTVEDPKGKVVISDWPIWQAMWPASCRKICLNDRPWHRIGWWAAATTVRDRWPDSWDKIKNYVGGQPWASMTDSGESSRTPWAGMDGNKPLSEVPFFSLHTREIWLEYEEWKELSYVYEVGVPTEPNMTYMEALGSGGLPTGGDAITSQTMDGKELAEFKRQHLAMTGEKVPNRLIVPKQKITYKYAYIVGPEVVETDEILIGQFTILFMTGFRYPKPTGTEWVGLVERMIEPQRWMNIFLTSMVKTLQINPKGVLVYEQGTFRNKAEAVREFTASGGTIEVPRGKLQGGNVPFQFIAGGSAPYSQMVDPLFQFYREAIPRSAGFNPGALGQLGLDLRRISGEVVKNVQDAAMASNGQLFDSLKYYRREAGRTLLAYLRTFWSDRPEELVEIVGRDAIQVVDPDTGEVRSALPPPEMWTPSAWREISVEEVAPVGDALESLWDSLTTHGVLQYLLQPQPDTGQPLLGSEDLIRMMPRLPAPMRAKKVMQIREMIKAMQKQQAAAAKQQQQGQGQQGQQTNQPPQQAAAA